MYKGKYTQRLTLKGLSKEEVIELNKTLTYREIADKLKCSKETVSSFFYQNKIKAVTKGTIEIYTDARSLIKSEYTYSAKKRGISFELTDNDFYYIIQQPCSYCGREKCNSVSWERKRILTTKEKLDFHYTGIDRIDSSIGYTLNNSVPCCKICNYAKNDLPIKDFEEWIRIIVAFQNNRLSNDLNI